MLKHPVLLYRIVKGKIASAQLIFIVILWQHVSANIGHLQATEVINAIVYNCII